MVLGLLAWDRSAGPAVWGFLALTFFVYPQVVYRVARAARDPLRVEHVNLLLDALLLGVWSAQFGFPLWVSYALLSAATLNNLVNRGLQGLLPSLLAFALGAGRVAARAGSFSAFCFRSVQLVGIGSINRASDHVLGRQILGMDRSIAPEQAADAGFDLKSALT